jgi:hypothetical protein
VRTEEEVEGHAVAAVALFISTRTQTCFSYKRAMLCWEVEEEKMDWMGGLLES